MQDDDQNDDDQKQRQNLIVLVVAVVLVIGSVWLLMTYKKYRERQDCFLAGHRNCAPVDTSASKVSYFNALNENLIKSIFGA
jgi:hypothetical protein